jgi:O-acetyl-ADP-ribose deacetylase (regulator of RNase III)
MQQAQADIMLDKAKALEDYKFQSQQQHAQQQYGTYQQELQNIQQQKTAENAQNFYGADNTVTSPADLSDEEKAQFAPDMMQNEDLKGQAMLKAGMASGNEVLNTANKEILRSMMGEQSYARAQTLAEARIAAAEIAARAGVQRAGLIHGSPQSKAFGQVYAGLMREYTSDATQINALENQKMLTRDPKVLASIENQQAILRKHQSTLELQGNKIASDQNIEVPSLEDIAGAVPDKTPTAPPANRPPLGSFARH